MPNTRQEVETAVYQLLGETDVSNEYSPSVVQAAIDRWQKDICSGKIVRLFADEKWSKVIRSKRLPFLEQRQAISLYEAKALTVIAWVSATTLTLDTTNYLAASPSSPKYVYANGNIMTYTGKTGTQLTGVSWLQTQLPVWTRINQLFLVDNLNVYKPYTVDIQSQNSGPIPCTQMPEGWYSYGAYFSLLNQWENRLLLINYNPAYSVWDIATYWIKYIQTAPDLTTDLSELVLPWTQGVTTVAPLVAGEMLYNTEETEFGIEKLNVGYRNLIQFYNGLNPQVDEMVWSVPRDMTWVWSTIWPNSYLTPNRPST